MAHTKIPLPAHGIAGFTTATFSGPLEPLYSGDVPLTTDHVLVTNALLVDLVLPYLAVVAYDPATNTMAMADQTDGPAYTVLPHALTVEPGDTVSCAIYRDGYFDMAALQWDASFNTDAKKKYAFEGGVNKILIGKKLPQDDNIVV